MSKFGNGPVWRPPVVVAAPPPPPAIAAPPPPPAIAAPPPPPAVAAPPPTAAAPFVVVNSAKEALAAWDAGQKPAFSTTVAIELVLLGFQVKAVLSTSCKPGNPSKDRRCNKPNCKQYFRCHSQNGVVPPNFTRLNGIFVVAEDNNGETYESPGFCGKSIKPWNDKEELWCFV